MNPYVRRVTARQEGWAYVNAYESREATLQARSVRPLEIAKLKAYPVAFAKVLEDATNERHGWRSFDWER